MTAIAVDQGTSLFSWREGRTRSRLVLLALFGMLVYVLVLFATLPAQFALRFFHPALSVDGVSGTVWRGSASVLGGHQFSWEAAPLRSTFVLGISADWTLRGRDTELFGNVAFAPGQIAVNTIDGRVGWPLVKSLMPNLPMDCDLSARLTVPTLRFGGEAEISGNMRVSGGVCRRHEADATEVHRIPPLTGAARRLGETTLFSLTQDAQPTLPLVDGSLSHDGLVALRLLPEGIKTFTGQSVSGPFTLQMQL